MVSQPKKASAPSALALSLCHFFCSVLLLALFAAPALAATEASPPLGELCLLPALEKSLAQYHNLAEQGGWVQIPPGPILQEGDQDERIPLLKERLIASDDLAAPAVQEDHFDTLLTVAVQRFQTRHGLIADGLVGPKTLAELNVPISERIHQLTASLERCQPLPQLLESRHILVNIADFTLTLFEEGIPVLSMPIIVGRTYRQTPVFTGRITTLVLNPSWEVPHSIATKDLLPKIKKDPGYLKQMGFRVFRDWKNTTEIDPATIDWTKLSQSHFPYRLSQDPGPNNALGQVKFLFPNPYKVYLHDTPAQELFQKQPRTFSSGCIRLAHPLDLALYLLQDTPLGSMDTLTEELAGQKTQWLTIPKPITIHIVYMTAWVDDKGIIQFRPDIYNRDPAQ